MALVAGFGVSWFSFYLEIFEIVGNNKMSLFIINIIM